MPVVLVPEPIVSISSLAMFTTIAITHFAYARRDGQAELMSLSRSG